MIQYHGGPITPDDCAEISWRARHAFISYAAPQQITLAAEICSSFAIDNGAFTFWKTGNQIEWIKFYCWLEKWINHPRMDFAVIPDVIEGSEKENDELIAEWPYDKFKGAPVWHTNESEGRFIRLCKEFPRVCIGSSGDYDVKYPKKYIARVKSILRLIVDKNGYPKCKIHALRGLNPVIFTEIPISSGDSTMVGRNIGYDNNWKGTYQPKKKTTRARILVERIEHFNSACRLQMDYDL